LKTSPLPVTRIDKSRIDTIDFDHLGFNNDYSDHMFRCEFSDAQWRNAQIVPYGPFEMEP